MAMTQPLSGREIDVGASAAFDKALEHPKVKKAMHENGVPLFIARNLHQLGYMDGGLAASERGAAILSEALDLLADLVDESECRFDHHGGCQMHGYLVLGPGEKCPHQAAKEYLAANKRR